MIPILSSYRLTDSFPSIDYNNEKGQWERERKKKSQVFFILYYYFFFKLL